MEFKKNPGFDETCSVNKLEIFDRVLVNPYFGARL
jgi:hypothetical protein